MKRLIFSLLASALLSLSLPAFATDTPPEEPPEKLLEGCTPGYWKNHVDAWVTFSPDQPVYDIFAIPSWLWPLVSGDTALYLLNYKGGPGDYGAARILLRHAMAAMLNATHPDVSYPALTTGNVQDLVADALAEDREVMLQEKAVLEFLNEAGCPL